MNVAMNNYRTIESVVLDQMRPGTSEPVTSSPRTTVDQGKHKQISFGLLNSRSVGNKYSTIYSEILDRRLDACLLTETWHQSNQDTALKRCVPPGYNLHDVPRPTSGAVQNHGGIAAIVSSEFVVRPMMPIKPPIVATTFESMPFTIGSSSSTLAVLLIYRPGSSPVTNQFFTEITSYLEHFALYKCRIIIAGDLNIHVDDQNNSNATRFLDLLASFDCDQHVHDPTHTGGRTLDHVITRRDEPISDLLIDPPGIISDHSFITWKQSFRFQPPVSTQRITRRWSEIDHDGFRQSLISSVLNSPISDSATTNDLFDSYESVLRDLADRFAPPIVTKSVRRQKIAVWCDDESRMMRRQSRLLERRYRRTKHPYDRLAWVQMQRERHRVNALKENGYWVSRVAEHKGQPRKLWKAFSSIMGLDRAAEIPIATSPSAQELLDYFVKKIE